MTVLGYARRGCSPLKRLTEMSRTFIAWCFALTCGGVTGNAQAQAPAPALAEALALTPDTTRGSALYAEACASCHRADGAGRAGGEMPALAGQHAAVTLRHLIEVREGRRVNPDMKQVLRDEPLSLQALADVALFIRHMPPATVRKTVGPGSHLTQGAALYQRDCTVCHGEEAQGVVEKFGPAIAGQHYPFLWRELNLIQQGMRGNSNPEMRRILSRYSPEELHSLADHLSHLPAQRTAR